MVETRGYLAFMEVLTIIQELNNEELKEFNNLLTAYLKKINEEKENE